MSTHPWIPAVAGSAAHLLPSEAHPDPDPVLALLCENALELASHLGTHLELRPPEHTPVLDELEEASLGSLLRLLDQVFRGLDLLRSDPGILARSTPSSLVLSRPEALRHARSIHEIAQSALVQRWPLSRILAAAEALWGPDSIHAHDASRLAPVLARRALEWIHLHRAGTLPEAPASHRLLSIARPLAHEVWHLRAMRLLGLAQPHTRVATAWTGSRLTELHLLPAPLAAALLDSPHATGPAAPLLETPAALPVREFCSLGASFLLDLGPSTPELDPAHLAAWRAGVLLEVESATPFAAPDLPHAAQLHRAARAALR